MNVTQPATRQCMTLLFFITLSLIFFISKMGEEFLPGGLRGVLRVFCRMMGERAATKALALRKSSVNAAIIIQGESIPSLPRAIMLSMGWAAGVWTRVSLGDEGR